MNKLALKYGSGYVDIPIDDDYTETVIKTPPFSINRVSFEAELEKYINRKKPSDAGIIISDKTRLCGYEIYLPWICSLLEKKGVLPGDITFYIAYGTHPAQSREESRKAYGDTYDKYRFIHHNCDSTDEMTTLGTTSYGTRVTVRKDILEHDLLILFGAISHHYFAGYGGGRKLIFPGLAERQAIYNNHKLYIDFEKRILHPGCQSGKLTGNPVAEDLAEIDSILPEKVVISGILDPMAEVSSLHISDNYKEFTDVCHVYDSYYRYPQRKQYDLVIASAGGFPKDINFIQTHKSLHNSAGFVKDGGKLILLAECRDGSGNDTFLRLFENSADKIVRSLKDNYSGNGGTALATLQKTSRINVAMLTRLSEKACMSMGINKVDIDTLNKIIDSEKGEKAVIKNASIIF